MGRRFDSAQARHVNSRSRRHLALATPSALMRDGNGQLPVSREPRPHTLVLVAPEECQVLCPVGGRHASRADPFGTLGSMQVTSWRPRKAPSTRLDPRTRALFEAWGPQGGEARAEDPSREERRERARRAVLAKWRERPPA